MAEIFLTQYTGKFIGPVAKLLGYLMNWIYMFLDMLHIQNIGLCIILFTLVIYLCLLPLTIKQQKSSKLQQRLQPELQEIQKKYKNKKDQASMMAMNEETQALYQKYGVSMTGSCLQLIIQMPILFALYRVIYNIPAYVTGVKEQFMPVVNGIMKLDGYQDSMTNFLSDIGLKTVQLNFNGTETQAANSIIDVLYKMPTSAWSKLRESFGGLGSVIDTLEVNLNHLNNFLGINISNSPMEIIKTGWSAGKYLLVFGAILVPILSAATQWLNYKLMPTAAAANTNNNNNGNTDTMASSMKMMNTMMPLMSFVMVFSLPVGMGIYWIAGAVIRSIQQVLINKHIESLDLDKVIEQNQEKARKKRAKKGIPENQISNMARMNTRSLKDKATITSDGADNGQSSKTENHQTPVNYSKDAKPGSLAAKANMVKEFNERNNKQ